MKKKAAYNSVKAAYISSRKLWFLKKKTRQNTAGDNRKQKQYVIQ